MCEICFKLTRRGPKRHHRQDSEYTSLLDFFNSLNKQIKEGRTGNLLWYHIALPFPPRNFASSGHGIILK